ncbi:MAG: DUF4339 domain-containing protein [Thermoguttaceae bacterium]|nr:DUF4339 domain-containing protein [Thermoguttaceae bacterium]
MELYYTKDGVRIGPVGARQLKKLARAGEISPNTPVEVKGRRVKAKRIKGIVFGAASKTVPPKAAPAEPIAPPTDIPPVAATPPVAEPEPVVFKEMTVRSTAEADRADGAGTSGLDRTAAVFRGWCRFSLICGIVFFVLAGVTVCGGVIAGFRGTGYPVVLLVVRAALPLCFGAVVLEWLAYYGYYILSRDRNS